MKLKPALLAPLLMPLALVLYLLLVLALMARDIDKIVVRRMTMKS